MKIFGVMLLSSLLLYADAFKVSLQELALMTSQANHINIILDSTIDLQRNFYFYDEFDPQLSKQSLQIILETSGLTLNYLGDVYYITNVDNNTTMFDHIKYRNITVEDVTKLSKFYNIQVTALGNSELIAKYTDDKNFISFKNALTEISSPKHILLEGEIIAVNESTLNDIGIDFASIASTVFQVGSFDLGLITNVNNNEFVQQIISSQSPLAGIGDISAFISFLKETGSASVVTRPNMLVMDGKESIFKSGQQIRIIDSATESIRQTGEYSSKQFRMLDVGLTLKCMAQIVENKASLDFEFTVSNLTQYQPLLDELIIDNKTYKSTFNIVDGEEIVLAGLTAATTIHKTAAVPFISDIPFFGELFKHDYDETQNISYLIYFKGTIK